MDGSQERRADLCSAGKRKGKGKGKRMREGERRREVAGSTGLITLQHLFWAAGDDAPAVATSLCEGQERVICPTWLTRNTWRCLADRAFSTRRLRKNGS